MEEKKPHTNFAIVLRGGLGMGDELLAKRMITKLVYG